MGAHAANNLCGALLTTYEGAAIQTDALFMVRELNPMADLPELILSGALFVGLLAYLYKWQFGVLHRPVPPPFKYV